MIATILSAIILLPFFIVSFIVFSYLTEYGSKRLILAAAISFGGILLSFAVYWIFTKWCSNKRRSLAFVGVLFFLLAGPLLSMKILSRITYSQFGMTVYGCVPIPILDITVGSNGGLWFRDKSHYISLEEVQALLTPNVDIVVIGIGWDNAVKVDEAIRNLKNVKIEILSTPDAYKIFNRYKTEGKKVILIAHSTC